MRSSTVIFQFSTLQQFRLLARTLDFFLATIIVRMKIHLTCRIRISSIETSPINGSHWNFQLNWHDYDKSQKEKYLKLVQMRWSHCHSNIDKIQLRIVMVAPNFKDHYSIALHQLSGPKGKDRHRGRAKNKGYKRCLFQPRLGTHQLAVKEVEGYEIDETHVNEDSWREGTQ